MKTIHLTVISDILCYFCTLVETHASVLVIKATNVTLMIME